MQILGEMIQELRKDNNLEQKDLAKVLNVSPGTISSYEIGRHTPNIENIIKLAEYFDVSVDDLVGNTPIRYNLSKLNREIISGNSYASIMNSVMGLNRKDLKQIIDYIDLLKLRSNNTLPDVEND